MLIFVMAALAMVVNACSSTYDVSIKRLINLIEDMKSVNENRKMFVTNEPFKRLRHLVT